MLMKKKSKNDSNDYIDVKMYQNHDVKVKAAKTCFVDFFQALGVNPTPL
jgi:predicted SnoaL-like aldol condensation-catalyzing enzyme